MPKIHALAAALAGAALLTAPLCAAPANDYRGPDQGAWNTAGNWSAITVPNGSDGTYFDVTNSSANGVVHASSLGAGGVDTINSLNFTGTGGLTLSGGILAGAQANAGGLFSVSGSLLFDGGTLRNMTLKNSDAAVFSNNSANTLDSVVLGGGLSLGGPTPNSPSGYLNITGAFGYSKGASFALDSQSTLNFAHSQVLDTASLSFDYFSTLQVSDGGTLTLGPNLTVSGRDGVITGDAAGAAIVNNADLALNGTFSSDFNLGGAKDSLTNNGRISMDGRYGMINIVAAGFNTDRTLTNNGTIEADNGATINIGPGRYAKLGTVNAFGDGSRIFLQGGTLSLGNGESLTTTGASLFALSTTLNNQGKTFDPTVNIGGTHNFYLDNGTISGGTVGHSDTLQFVGGTINHLQNVALDGGLSVNGGEVSIEGTFSHGAGATLAAGANGHLQFNSDYTLDGATIALGVGGYTGFLDVGTGHTLTLGPSVLLASGSGQIGGGALVNEASLSLTGGSTIIANSILTNNGTITASGSNIYLQPGVYGRVGTLQSSGASGALFLQGGTLHLGAGDQLRTDTGGKIVLQTTLDNSGRTLDLAGIGSSGSLVDIGTIKGGILTNSDRLAFSEGVNGTLQDVTLAGADGLNIGASQTAAISGTFAYGAGTTFRFGGFGRLSFNTDYTLAHANVALGDSLGNFGFLTSTGGHTLTLDSTSRFTGAAGEIDGDGIVNNAVITSDAGQDWIVRGTTLVNNGVLQVTHANSFLGAGDAYTNSFINNGTLQAVNGGGASVGDGNYSAAIPTNTGTVFVGSGSQIRLNKGLMQTDGSTRVDGSLYLLSGTTNDRVIIQGGKLSGGGTIQGNVEVEGGTLSPGDATGTLTVARNVSYQTGTGNYTQGARGTFLEHLGGTGAGQFGVLSVSDLATLDGTLDVSLGNGFRPTVGETFTFLDYGSLSGTFTTVAGLDPGYGYRVAYGATDAVLTVTAVAAAPEPSQFAGLALGVLSLAGQSLRARKRQNAA